jgi:hypothetical protein
MVAVFVVAVIVMLAVVGASAFVIARKSSGEQATVQQFQASLAKNLPPDVQADMKPRRLGLVTSMAISVVVLPIFVAGLIATGKARAMIFVGLWLVLVVGCATWSASIARTLLGRRNPGEVLVDLSPYPLAGAVRRSSRLVWVACTPMLFVVFMGFAFSGSQTAGDRLFLAFWAAYVPLALLTNLMYSDRVWLAERGLYFGGRLYPWDDFERVAWTDDGRAFALRRCGRWPLRRWIVAPVSEASREAVEEALRRVIPAPTPTV